MSTRGALRDGWRAAGWYPDQTIGEAIAAGAVEHPDGRIVFEQCDDTAVEFTLSELQGRIEAAADRLRAAGIGAGDAVVVQTPADAPGIETIAGLWHLEAVVVPLVVTAVPAEVELAVEQTGARFVIDGAGIRAASWKHRRTDRAPGARTGNPRAVACVLYTSGSTGVPKGVQHSHETLLTGLGLAADPTVRTLTSFPAGHIASVLGLLRALVAGGTTVVMDRWSARRAARIIEEYRITASAGTPFYLSTLLDEAERAGRDISSLVRFLVGAATVPPALVARAEAAGIVTWRTYGSTEQPAIAGGAAEDPPDKRRLTDGRIGPGNEVRIVDAELRDVAPGEEGEILARGPRQFIGYRDESLDVDAFVDGTWFRTGDQGWIDEDGFLTITDRLKDLIIRGGENISAREVEDVLAEHPAIGEVAVCRVSDDVFGEIVGAVLRVRPGHAVTLDELRSFATDAGLAPHKLPARVVVVDEFPRTAAGKIRKRDLRPLLS